jgi:hypothetical protein
MQEQLTHKLDLSLREILQCSNNWLKSSKRYSKKIFPSFQFRADRIKLLRSVKSCFFQSWLILHFFRHFLITKQNTFFKLHQSINFVKNTHMCLKSIKIKLKYSIQIRTISFLYRPKRNNSFLILQMTKKNSELRS